MRHNEKKGVKNKMFHYIESRTIKIYPSGTVANIYNTLFLECCHLRIGIRRSETLRWCPKAVFPYMHSAIENDESHSIDDSLIIIVTQFINCKPLSPFNHLVILMKEVFTSDMRPFIFSS